MAGILLTIDNGAVVDEHLATSGPELFATGDLANANYPLLDTHLRLEHWSAAHDRGAVASANMVGRNVSYDRVSYFFSDQHNLGTDYTGYVDKGRYDHVVFRDDTTKGEYIAFWMKDGRVLAGMNGTVCGVTDDVASLVRSRVQVDEAKLADVTVPLGDLASDAGLTPP